MTPVPTIALPKPPPRSNAAGGSSVNTSRLSLDPPLTTSMYNTENSGTQAMSAIAQVIALSAPLRIVRGRNQEWRSCCASMPVVASSRINCHPGGATLVSRWPHR